MVHELETLPVFVLEHIAFPESGDTWVLIGHLVEFDIVGRRLFVDPVRSCVRLLLLGMS
jgi:hypothetical protein